jgi:hypothetical protein
VTKRRKPKRYAPEVEKLLDQARRSERQPQRKHHVVPQSYLSRWESAGMLTATAVVSRRTHTQSAAKIARETDFYRIASEDIDPDVLPPLFFETLLGEIEGNAARAIDALIDSGFGAFHAEPERGSWLATFLAFQIIRGNTFREEHRALTNKLMLEHYRNYTDDDLAKMAARKGRSATDQTVAGLRSFLEEWKAGQARVAPPQAALIGRGGEMAYDFGLMLFDREWRIYEAPADLITCDEPVVVVAGPPASRRISGGIANAGAILFPLSPRVLLAMFHEDIELTPILEHPYLSIEEVGQVNLEVASNAHRWMIERPPGTHARTLPLPIPVNRFKMDVFAVDGESDSKVLHTRRGSRWALAGTLPAWPIARWWPDGSAADPLNEST